MILLVITAVMLYFNVQQFITINNAGLQEYSFIVCNILCSICLFVLANYKLYIERGLSKQVLPDDEDVTFNKFERALYKASFFGLLAIVLSLVTLIISFITVRDSHPVIAGYSFLLCTISLFSYMIGPKSSELLFPNLNDNLMKQVTSVEETLEFYDDGQKHVMLKALYRLYFSVIMGLVLLMFFLMFYSIFSGVSQIISIIGIGILLLVMLIVFMMCLMPKKITS